MSFSNKTSLMSAIVKLFHVEHKRQYEIAKLTGMSRASVSRLLAEAYEVGMVQIKTDEEEVRCKELEEKINEQSDFKLKDIFVIKTWQKNQKKLCSKNIGIFAAPFLLKMLHPNIAVGVSGGRHVFHIINELSPATIPGISVFQMVGNAGALAMDYDPMHIARRFADKFKARCLQIQAPAIVATCQERDIFVKHSYISPIFEIMKNIKLAIVGVSTPKDSILINNFFESEIVSYLEQKGVVGEICGHFFDIDGREVDTKYKECVVGITLEQLKNIPNVVAVTSGVHRVNAIWASIKTNIIKTLITDENTAEVMVSSS